MLCGIVLGTPVFGLVTLNALLAQSSFRVDDLQQRIQDLSQRNVELTIEHAKLSAPGRIAAWARRHGMRLPDDIRALHVPSAGPAVGPAGDADPFAGGQDPLAPTIGGGA